MKRIIGLLIICMFMISIVSAGCGCSKNKGVTAQATAQQIRSQVRVQENPECSYEDCSKDGNCTKECYRKLKRRSILRRLNQTINITEQETENGTILILEGDGKNRTIKIMPETASEVALERLRLKVCNETNNCTIELKEVPVKRALRLAYRVRARKRARLLGFIKTQMNVEADVDAETGEVIRRGRPWWAWMAVEEDETEESE